MVNKYWRHQGLRKNKPIHVTHEKVLQLVKEPCYPMAVTVFENRPDCEQLPESRVKVAPCECCKSLAGLTVSPPADGHCWTAAGESRGTSRCSNPIV